MSFESRPRLQEIATIPVYPLCARCSFVARAFNPATALLIVLCVAWFIAPVAAQTRPGTIKTDEPDVTIVLGGAVAIDGVLQDSFFRGNGRGDKGWEFASLYLRLDVDFRLGTDVTVFGALATKRRVATALTFGGDFPRTRGNFVSTDAVALEADELFIEVKQLLAQNVAIRVGLTHFALGVDNSDKDVWPQGHGRLWFDSRDGAGPPGHARLHPVGVQARFLTGTDSTLAATGTLAWLDRDFATDRALWLAAVEAQTVIDKRVTFNVGYARLSDQTAPDLETLWIGAKLQAETTLLVYGEGAFNLGNQHSGVGVYGATRFVLDAQQGFIDISAWLLTGDDPTTGGFEGYRGFGSLRTTLIVDSRDFGMGRHTNLTALKIVGSYALSYQWTVRIVFARYAVQNSAAGGRPGDEIDVLFSFAPTKTFRVEVGGGFVFGSRIHGPGGAPDGWMGVVMLHGDF